MKTLNELYDYIAGNITQYKLRNDDQRLIQITAENIKKSEAKLENQKLALIILEKLKEKAEIRDISDKSNIAFVIIPSGKSVKKPTSKVTVTSTQARAYFISYAKSISQEPLPGDRIEDYKNFMVTKMKYMFDNEHIDQINLYNKESQKEFLNGLPIEIKNSIRMYTNYEEEVPGLLRNLRYDKEALSPKEKKVMIDIDKAFLNLQPIMNETVLYRGIRLNSFEQITEHFWYVSASSSIYYPLKDFSIDSCCFLIITIPPGSKILYISDISSEQSEDEVLIDKNGSFVITLIEPGSVYNMLESGFVPDTVYMTYLPPRVRGVPKFHILEGADELIQLRTLIIKKYIEMYKEKPINLRAINAIYRELKPRETVDISIDMLYSICARLSEKGYIIPPGLTQQIKEQIEM